MLLHNIQHTVLRLSQFRCSPDRTAVAGSKSARLWRVRHLQGDIDEQVSIVCSPSSFACHSTEQSERATMAQCICSAAFASGTATAIHAYIGQRASLHKASVLILCSSCFQQHALRTFYLHQPATFKVSKPFLPVKVILACPLVPTVKYTATATDTEAATSLSCPLKVVGREHTFCWCPGISLAVRVDATLENPRIGPPAREPCKSTG